MARLVLCMLAVDYSWYFISRFCINAKFSSSASVDSIYVCNLNLLEFVHIVSKEALWEAQTGGHTISFCQEMAFLAVFKQGFFS